MRSENIILPDREDVPRLARLHRAISRLAGFCSWRCPLGALVLVVSAHLFATPSWWKTTSDILVGILIVLLFCCYGLTIAIGAIVVVRPDRRFERIGLLLGIVGGVGFAALGIIGAWALVRSAVGGL